MIADGTQYKPSSRASPPLRMLLQSTKTSYQNFKKKKKNDKHPIATEEVFARPNVQYSSVERQKDNHEYRVVLLVGKCLLRVGTV